MMAVLVAATEKAETRGSSSMPVLAVIPCRASRPRIIV